ncbi:hypothetical protein Q4511_11645 [Paracoccus sp. 1_MG-2023]|uniref:hypothetical protein n=1 Tax=unclassified Paracoccus (in: a-proteobacteria) TaxID=2688777 RepID=UPI001C085BA4|nr:MULTISPECIES: hypothetical protein [unclassified Paracoccus (in: a-proteobacteria)]MBU2957090.1 hypothetical protein [Paracoccus sp. C2R09]MDO6669576.1 hypothetical protein [Paracoccus sp. 1_MG-2023]
MTGVIIQTLAALIFVIGGIVFSWRTHPPVFTPPMLSGPAILTPYNVTSNMPTSGAPELAEGMAIPLLYLDPANVLMWALLLLVWFAIGADVLGQWLDPTDRRELRNGRSRIWPQLAAALIALAISPWLFPNDREGLLLGTGIGMLLAIWAARRAAGRQRPAVGFLAGWATALFSATLAGSLTDIYNLQTQAIAALAILPGTAIGMAAQIWIGPSIGYSMALICAFCAVAVTAMGSDPVIALAAILGISGMAAVLIRAAS